MDKIDGLSLDLDGELEVDDGDDDRNEDDLDDGDVDNGIGMVL